MLPNLPTDNLYKFVTVLGAALMAIAVSYYVTATGKVFASAAMAQASIQAAAAHRADVETRLRALEEDPGTATAEGIAYAREQIARLRELDAVADRDYGTFDFENQHLNAMTWGLLSTALVGCLAFLWGTISWYFNHQRYQDAIVRREAEVSNAPN